MRFESWKTMLAPPSTTIDGMDGLKPESLLCFRHFGDKPARLLRFCTQALRVEPAAKFYCASTS